VEITNLHAHTKQMLTLPEQVKTISKDGNTTVFEISPLMPGYGATIANPLRRVLLSSLEGAAVTAIKIKGVDHEFSTLANMQEDIIEIILNVKKLRFKLLGDGPVKVTLSVKGDKVVTGADIDLTSDVELINEDQHIATLTDKKAELNMELDIEKGVGYVPVEQRKKEKLAIGAIAVDAVFSPVQLVNFSIENIRVGDRIDFNKVVLTIETDGSIEPEEALQKAAVILNDHFRGISEIKIEVSEEKKSTKKKKSK